MPTKIEWTFDPITSTKGETWNFIKGCSRVDRRCDGCYAMFQVHRGLDGENDAGLTKIRPKDASRPGVDWTGKVRIITERLAKPLRWKRPRRVFVNSLSDLFHAQVPFEIIAAAFGVMAATPQHTYMILTKRLKEGRAREFFAWLEKAAAEHRYHLGETCDGPMNAKIWRFIYAMASKHIGEEKFAAIMNRRQDDWYLHGPWSWPLPNVWLGASPADQKTVEEDVPELLMLPAAVRWLSVEPMLGPIDLMRVQWPGRHKVDVLSGGAWDYGFPGFTQHSDLPTIDLLVCGGESGRRARPMHPRWARSLRDQCRDAGVPFFFKQWGEHAPWLTDNWFTRGGDETRPHTWVADDGQHGACWIYDADGTWSNHTGDPPVGEDGKVLPTVAIMSRVGKKNAGRHLDGVLHDEWPAPKKCV